MNGESTTHYKATIDLSTPRTSSARDAQAMVQHLIDQGGPASIPVDVWIGDDGLVRKLTIDETPRASAGQTAASTWRSTLSDYGTAVNVTAPPSGDTLDLTRSPRRPHSRCGAAPPASAARPSGTARSAPRVARDPAATLA